MSVRLGILALLAEEPMHCYHVRQRFEERTGGTWPLNIGQAYTTVQRLVRDGLVEPDGTQDESSDVERFRLTAAGRDEVASWWTTPVVRGTPSRDELAIKIALAVTAPGVDVRSVVQTQRTESMRALRDYTRLAAEQGTELTWALVLDNLVFTTEAEIRWLDHVEARIARAGASNTAARPAVAATPTRTSATTHDAASLGHDAASQGGAASTGARTAEGSGSVSPGSAGAR